MEEREEMVVKVGAIVLAPGFGAFDPKLRGDYGYGTIKNVVTSLDFERLMCATGPHEGEILRPSDGKHPHKIAWIHCVGSRQVLEGAHSYCSSVCCMYAIKDAMIAKEHAEGDLDAAISAWVTANQNAVNAAGGCSPTVTNDFTTQSIDFCTLN